MISSRPDCRAGLLRCDPVTDGEAWYCQGNHAEDTRTTLAEAMGVNPSTLGNWLDPHHASRMPDDRRIELLRLTDDHSAYVRYLATLQGLVVYDPKTARGRGVTRMVSEFGDLLKAIDTRSDGTSVDDARRVQREGLELIAAVDFEVQDALRAAGLSPSSDGSGHV